MSVVTISVPRCPEVPVRTVRQKIKCFLKIKCIQIRKEETTLSFLTENTFSSSQCFPFLPPRATTPLPSVAERERGRSWGTAPP